MQKNSKYSQQKMENKNLQTDQPFVINRVVNDMHDVAGCLHQSEHNNNQHMVIDLTTRVKMINTFKEKCLSKDELSIAEVLKEIQTYGQYVSNVPKKDYALIKSFAHPPTPVLVVAEGCCIIFADYLKNKQGIRDIYHQSAPGEPIVFSYKTFLKLLRDPINFMKIVRELNLKTIPDDRFVLLKKRILDNPDFDSNRLENMSYLALALWEWIKKVYQYYIAKDAVKYQIGRDRVGKQSTHIGDKILMAAVETYHSYFQKYQIQKLLKLWQQILGDANILYSQQNKLSALDVQCLKVQKSLKQSEISKK